jgi:hypothetical protein
VNTPPPKGGGFGLRLKAGSVRLAANLSVTAFTAPPCRGTKPSQAAKSRHWRAQQTERATKHTYRWTPAQRSATKRATNPYGITLDRVWTDWAAQHGVSETIAAALYLVSRDRKADDAWLSLRRPRRSE